MENKVITNDNSITLGAKVNHVDSREGVRDGGQFLTRVCQNFGQVIGEIAAHDMDRYDRFLFICWSQTYIPDAKDVLENFRSCMSPQRRLILNLKVGVNPYLSGLGVHTVSKVTLHVGLWTTCGLSHVSQTRTVNDMVIVERSLCLLGKVSIQVNSDTMSSHPGLS